MLRLAFYALLGAITVAGCSDQSNEQAQSVTSMDVAEPAPAAPKPEAAPTSPGGATSAIPVSMPKIAYVYDFGFRLAAEKIPELQRRHADLCERQGPQVCRILDMRQSGAEGDYASGSLSLAVAALRARSFGAELGKAVETAGGSEVSSAITGEDLSKQIVDTEARLRARTLLRDRLMEVLATRKGTVAELVEAERGVAQVNEEIDQARSWLAEMQGRVDFSRINVSYESGAPTSGGFIAPIREAFGSIGSILGVIIAAIIVIVTSAVPIGLVVLALWAAVRWVRRRALLHRTIEDGHAAGEPEGA
jgi:hypothetical protein